MTVNYLLIDTKKFPILPDEAHVIAPWSGHISFKSKISTTAPLCWVNPNTLPF